MSILITKETRLLVQGITGNEGLFHSRQMLDYGTEVVAGVTDPMADSVCETLLEAVHNHACGRPLEDDATLLVVERLSE